MRKMLGLLACLGLMALPAAAQFTGGAPMGEVGGGYAFRSLDTPLSPRLTTNGFFANVEFNLNNFIGVSTDADFTRANKPNAAEPVEGMTELSSVMVGPQIYPLGHHRITPFFKAQVGLVHYSNTESNAVTSCQTESLCTVTDGSFGFGAGAGVDFSVTKMFAIRLGEIDYEQSRMFEPNQPSVGDTYGNQSNYKLKAGIIIRFGER
jgi:opacity protein-like surface antigen